MPLQVRGQLEQPTVVEAVGAADRQRPCGYQPGHDRGGGRAEPPALRDAVRADDLQPPRLAAELVEAGPHRPDHQVPAGPGQLVGALAGDVNEQSLVGDPHHDVVVAGQGQPQRVEAGTEVRAGRGRPDPDRGGTERRPSHARQAIPARAHRPPRPRSPGR